MGQTTQFVVHQGEEAIERLLIAFAPLPEQTGVTSDGEGARALKGVGNTGHQEPSTALSRPSTDRTPDCGVGVSRLDGELRRKSRCHSRQCRDLHTTSAPGPPENAPERRSTRVSGRRRTARTCHVNMEKTMKRPLLITTLAKPTTRIASAAPSHCCAPAAVKCSPASPTPPESSQILSIRLGPNVPGGAFQGQPGGQRNGDGSPAAARVGADRRDGERDASGQFHGRYPPCCRFFHGSRQGHLHVHRGER